MERRSNSPSGTKRREKKRNWGPQKNSERVPINWFVDLCMSFQTKAKPKAINSQQFYVSPVTSYQLPVTIPIYHPSMFLFLKKKIRHINSKQGIFSFYLVYIHQCLSASEHGNFLFIYKANLISTFKFVQINVRRKFHGTIVKSMDDDSKKLAVKYAFALTAKIVSMRTKL